MQNFSDILTKNEDQYQYVLQVTEQHRQNLPHYSTKYCTTFSTTWFLFICYALCS